MEEHQLLFKNALTETDFYKFCHHGMYPENMTLLYSTWTPRSNKFFPYTKQVVWFGLQGVIQDKLINFFNQYFFDLEEEQVIKDFKVLVGTCFDPDLETKHIRKLHQLGYLPIKIKALPEGTLVPIGVPMMTIENTHPEFAWLTNFLETLISQNLWHPTTTATISYVIETMLKDYLERCNEDTARAKSLYGDFSPRGMSSSASSESGGAGHLTSSVKTSSPEAIRYLVKYYHGDLEKEKIGEWSTSVEHSCVCTNYFMNHNNEEVFFEALLHQHYSTKPFTYVADSFDFWSFVTESLPKFKDAILQRKNAKVSIRPDSGLPEDILCGDVNGENEAERKGLVEVLWDIFGGSINEAGYKKIDEHIGIVYGDSITIERCQLICERLLEKGFAIDNVVFGIGSYTYNMISRDTLGHALKATYCEISGQSIPVFKNPKTDKDAMKKSQKGKVAVIEEEGKLVCIDGLTTLTEKEIQNNLLQTVFYNGKLVKECSLHEIRNRLHPGEF